MCNCPHRLPKLTGWASSPEDSCICVAALRWSMYPRQMDWSGNVGLAQKIPFISDSERGNRLSTNRHRTGPTHKGPGVGAVRGFEALGPRLSEGKV